ncbi:hypothetical protein Q9R34_11185 [Enterobacter sp. BRE11]|nr:hypothetical protein [Enterobacter sp. BRE11]
MLLPDIIVSLLRLFNLLTCLYAVKSVHNVKKWLIPECHPEERSKGNRNAFGLCGRKARWNKGKQGPEWANYFPARELSMIDAEQTQSLNELTSARSLPACWLSELAAADICSTIAAFCCRLLSIWLTAIFTWSIP